MTLCYATTICLPLKDDILLEKSLTQRTLLANNSI